MTEQPSLFETEQQIRKDKALAAATAYLRGRSGRKRRPGCTKHSSKNFAGFKGLKKKFRKMAFFSCNI